MEKSKPERRLDLDWLRVLLILSVFLFHSGRAFLPIPWHINDPVGSSGMIYFAQFMLAWMLPTIFIISGASIWYSLGFQKAGRFLRGKVLRLLVPLVFGIFILSPHQVYIERLTNGQVSGSFIKWFPQYFEGVYGFGGNFAIAGHHLWYLLFLFMFSLILLPLFLFLRSERGRPVTKSFGSFLRIPGMIYVLGLILTVPMAFINPESFFGMREGFADWNIIYYISVLFFGFMFFADKRIQESIMRQRWVSLIVGIVLYLLFRVFRFSFRPSPFQLGWFHYVLSSWCLIMAILGFGMKYLTGAGRFIRYANEGVLPFYVLHQPIIVLIAFWVIQLKIPIVMKFIIIVVLSFIAIIVLFEGIRRVGVLRFLFGMKVKRASASSQK
ncbi:MAG: acyltransferase family protein [Spirochaetota bacterium]|nr:MAG: acyltransferase family protein [Spirochaetota bacterium]